MCKSLQLRAISIFGRIEKCVTSIRSMKCTDEDGKNGIRCGDTTTRNDK
jgi:hypothetical protein